MTTTASIPPITKSVVVECPADVAFMVYTERLNEWWPLGTHSVFEHAASTVVWELREGGEVYELSAEGERADWADVRVWDPPHRFVIAWRVNPNDPAATEVDVRFTAEAAGRTRVDMEHRRWELLGDQAGADKRAGYNQGWDPVLAEFVAFANSLA